MSTELRIAVVGHTNTGKTSLMRTLLHDVEFGEVSDRPAVTRDVQAAALVVNPEPGRSNKPARVLLWDTPGLEDSIGLWDHLQQMRGQQRTDGLELIEEFLESPAAEGRFRQEAKALQQVLASDLALYVVDARDRVMGKHRDELSILGYCARPVVPVLNFVASPEARTAEWREHLSRVNMHAVAEFDTVAFDARSEQRLFEKMMSLLDDFRPLLSDLIEDRKKRRRELVRASAAVIAEMLIDAAACVVSVPLHDRRLREETLEKFKTLIRQREQDCVAELLELHRFRSEDQPEDVLPLTDGKWGADLFSPAALKQFGLLTGGGAAAGAMVGLSIDALLGGMSLGAGALLGAAAGALLGAGKAQGKSLLRRAGGKVELRCDDATLELLKTRSLALADALLHRGHAALQPVKLKLPEKDSPDQQSWQKLWDEVRLHPRWARSMPGDEDFTADPLRDKTLQEMTDLLLKKLSQD